MRTELVTTLKRKATDLLAELKSDKKPILITQHGLPSAYMIDVESYDALKARLSILENIARGEKAVEDGRTLTTMQARKKMQRWLK